MVVVAAVFAVAFASASTSAPPGTMALESDPCVGTIDVLVVDVAVGVQKDPWVGGQALLAYDTSRLSLVGPISGDPIFDLPIYYSANPGLGHIDLAAGISPGGGSTFGGVVLMRLAFLPLETPDPCPKSELVWFRSDPNFETRLGMDDGTPIYPTLTALNPVSITDGPTITPPPDVVWNLPLFTGCVTTGDPGFATASSPCGAEPTITWVRSDGELTLDAPYRYIDSPITITWTATDDCGNMAGADQTITVTGCLADLNGDLTVDGSDLAIVLGFWGVHPGYIGDLNCDGIVDGNDLAILLGHWGPCPS